jgi:murein hydrolase activator
MMMNVMKKLYVLLFLCFWLITSLYAQKSKQDLENDRKTQQKKIEEADRILKKTLTYKQEKLGKLAQINREIEQRSALISIILQEIPLIDKEILTTDSLLKANATQLQKLKEEYAEMLYLSSKTKNS